MDLHHIKYARLNKNQNPLVHDFGKDHNSGECVEKDLQYSEANGIGSLGF